MDRVHPRRRLVTEVAIVVAVIVTVAQAIPEDPVIRPAAIVERAIEIVIEAIAVNQGNGTRSGANGAATVVDAPVEQQGD
jgi:hypothetical protein